MERTLQPCTHICMHDNSPGCKPDMPVPRSPCIRAGPPCQLSWSQFWTLADLIPHLISYTALSLLSFQPHSLDCPEDLRLCAAFLLFAPLPVQAPLPWATLSSSDLVENPIFGYVLLWEVPPLGFHRPWAGIIPALQKFLDGLYNIVIMKLVCVWYGIRKIDNYDR